jgi:hypothetical protein
MICVAAFQVLRGTNPRRNATIVVVILVLIVLFRLLDTRGTEGLSGRESAIIDMLWTNLGHTLTGVLPVNAVNFLEDSFPKGFLGNKIVPIFNSILTIAALVTTLVVVRRRPIWLIMTVGFVASWLLIVSTSRYVLVIMPLVAFAWWKSSLSLRGRFGGRMGNVLCATMLALWIGMNGAKCVGLIIEQRRVPFIVHYRRGAYEGVRELGLKFRDTVDENAIILSPQRCSGPVMFFSGMTADMPNRMQPIDNDTNRQILVIAPMDEPLKHMFKERGWRAGPTVWSVPRRGNTEPWTLHRVIRSPE